MIGDDPEMDLSAKSVGMKTFLVNRRNKDLSKYANIDYSGTMEDVLNLLKKVFQ